MQEHEQIRAAERKLDLALFANGLIAGEITSADSFTPQSAQETAGKFIFYRLQAEQQLRTYRYVISEFHPEEPLFENELTSADREEMATALDEAKNGNYQKAREYLSHYLDGWPPNALNPQLARNIGQILTTMKDSGEPFQEPLFPYDDPVVIESYEETRAFALKPPQP